MLELFLSAFITLFVVIDPPGCAPIYAGLTKGASPAQARNMAIRACVIASVILLVFALFGQQLLGALHIELDSFRIAGGIMLFMIAIDMVFEKRTQRREERAEKIAATPEVEDVSVFPMAMPMLAGPGAIAAVMLLQNEAEGLEQTLVVLGALALVMVLTMLALIAAGPLIRLLGDRVEAVITRLLGVLLAALGGAICDRWLEGEFRDLAQPSPLPLAGTRRGGKAPAAGGGPETRKVVNPTPNPSRQREGNLLQGNMPLIGIAFGKKLQQAHQQITPLA